MLRNRWIMLGLIVLTLVCYWRVGRFDYINYDDPKYITANEDVAHGFTGEALKQSFTSTAGGYLHPVTWWTHYADVSLYGMGPGSAGGHHTTSLLLHTVNTVLLFWVLFRLTGAAWPSAWVAAVFAIHPAHVESVAWISERKDVLSGLFFLLTIWAYASYGERRAFGRYLVVVLAFAAALMSKPMMVMTPLVLLLLDVWPLRRTTPAASGVAKRVGGLVVEKLPLLAMSLAWGVVTIRASQSISTFASLQSYPLGYRLQTSIVAYARYVGKLLWPTKLSIFYPHPVGGWPAALVSGAAALLVIVTAAVIWQAKKRPYLLVGWLWFVLTLLPVIGLLVTGDASLADRYTYTPFIGLFIAIAWLVREIGHRMKMEQVVGGIGAAALAGCLAVTWVNLPNWKDSLSIMGHALAVTQNNWLANERYAAALRSAGRTTDAEPYITEAYRLRPDSQTTLVPYARNLLEHGRLNDAARYIMEAGKTRPLRPDYFVVLGQYYAAVGRHADAVTVYRESLKTRRRDSDTLVLCAQSLTNLGRLDEAEAALKQAAEISSGSETIYYRLAKIAAARNQASDAEQYFTRAIELNDHFGEAHLDYGVHLARLQRYPDALKELSAALQYLKPDDYTDRARAELTVGKVLLELGSPVDTVEHYRKAVQYATDGVNADPKDPAARYELAYTLQQVGRTDEARAEAEKGIDVATKAHNQYMLNQLKGLFASPTTTTAPSTRP
jgi:tetratricopeptide (TPR) repeat protein